MNTYTIIGVIVIVIIILYIAVHKTDAYGNNKNNNKLLKMSLEDMALYADNVTKENASNEDFLRVQLPENLIRQLKSVNLTSEIKKQLLSRTTFGNSAYSTIHSPEPYKSRAKDAIDYMKTLL